MPKSVVRPSLRINILKSQSAPQPIINRILKWLLSTGRYIIIFVEIIVLAAFVSRFKFDYDLANTKDAINKQIPVIESLRPDERLIRKTQLQLATIKDVRLGAPNYINIVQRISAQQPQSLVITNLELEQKDKIVNIKIEGESQNNNDLTILVAGLKGDATFQNILLTNVSLDQNVVSFTITGQANTGGI